MDLGQETERNGMERETNLERIMTIIITILFE